jgi:hypothetical protein
MGIATFKHDAKQFVANFSWHHLKNAFNHLSCTIFFARYDLARVEANSFASAWAADFSKPRDDGANDLSV